MFDWAETLVSAAAKQVLYSQKFPHWHCNVQLGLTEHRPYQMPCDLLSSKRWDVTRRDSQGGFSPPPYLVGSREHCKHTHCKF